MKINKSLIETLNPCKDRFDNYLLHYSNKSFTVQQFMGLKRITHSDKLWVTFRLLSKNKLRLAAADIAESVLHIFENKYPNDKRPRLAIETARKGNTTAAISTAANAANAAYATATAAFSTAATAANAAYAAARATDAAYAAARATVTAASGAGNLSSKARKTQERLIRKIIIGYLTGRK